ncbi:methionine synthase [Nocardioides sp. AE5]|uniref:methionine synthase n=1 Tax=Nocardioides sp. AE5 TaxID=2962573 RepID=UPI002880EA1F|nr:methionine synthase [Nocardioides sp. AE5]MDT0202823.1 methionine synthase [Nocardioides sp. AE5]
MVLASGIGSMPGGSAQASEADNARAFDEAARVVVGELTDLLAIPELPGRGAIASMTGRTLGLVTEIPADLQPFGWRLAGATGMDQRRARSLLAQDLDRIEELTQGFTGIIKQQVAGPWTLAATVDKPRGDKVLSDHGARRDLAEALGEALAAHVADLRRRVPGAGEIIIQVDEPALPAVLAAQVPTLSGWGKHRAVAVPDASAMLERLFATMEGAGATPIVHCCAPGLPISLVRGAGARGVAVDLAMLDAGGYDDLAATLEAGERVLLGVVPTTGDVPGDARVTEQVLRLFDLIGLEPTASLVITPACGLAGGSMERARAAITVARKVAANLS